MVPREGQAGTPRGGEDAVRGCGGTAGYAAAVTEGTTS